VNQRRVTLTFDHQNMPRTRFLLRIASLVLPILYLIFLLADRAGVWSRLRGLDLVENVATRFEKSYGPDASAPVKVGDQEWEPLINLIYKYSRADFPKDKNPEVVARFQAVLSGKQETPEGQLIAEWTAPSTPFVVIYRKWPGQSIPREDYRIAGTIGDLRSWVARSKDDARFLAKDVFLVLFSFVVGFSLLLVEHIDARQAATLAESGMMGSKPKKKVFTEPKRDSSDEDGHI